MIGRHVHVSLKNDHRLRHFTSLLWLPFVIPYALPNSNLCKIGTFAHAVLDCCLASILHILRCRVPGWRALGGSTVFKEKSLCQARSILWALATALSHGNGCKSLHLKREKAHGEWRRINYPHFLFFKIRDEVGQALIIQAVMAIR